MEFVKWTDEKIKKFTGYKLDIQEYVDGDLIEINFADRSKKLTSSRINISHNGTVIPATSREWRWQDLLSFVDARYDEIAAIAKRGTITAVWAKFSHNIPYNFLPQYLIIYGVGTMKIDDVVNVCAEWRLESAFKSPSRKLSPSDVLGMMDAKSTYDTQHSTVGYMLSAKILVNQISRIVVTKEILSDAWLARSPIENKLRYQHQFKSHPAKAVVGSALIVVA